MDLPRPRGALHRPGKTPGDRDQGHQLRRRGRGARTFHREGGENPGPQGCPGEEPLQQVPNSRTAVTAG